MPNFAEPLPIWVTLKVIFKPPKAFSLGFPTQEVGIIIPMLTRDLGTHSKIVHRERPHTVAMIMVQSRVLVVIVTTDVSKMIIATLFLHKVSHKQSDTKLAF